MLKHINNIYYILIMSIINCSGVYIRVLSVVSHTVVVLNYTLHYQGCIMLHYYSMLT